MIVVVLGVKKQHVDQPHRALEPRMPRDPGKGLGLEPLQSRDQAGAVAAAAAQDVGKRPPVMLRSLGPRVGHIRGSENRHAVLVVGEARQKEGLIEISKMASMFLYGPAAAVATHAVACGHRGETLREPGGCAPEP